MAVNAPYIGIDVYNGYGYINWDLVYGNIDFVMIKAGQGTGFIDPKFDYNARSCERLGIPYGVYWFSNAYTVQAAHAEAVVCVDTLLNNGNPYNPTFPVAFDWERTDAPSGTPIADMTRDFLDYVASYGFIPMVYANPALLNTALASIYANEIANGTYELWFARYTSSDTPGYNYIGIWQKELFYNIPGIAVSNTYGIDGDYGFKDYGNYMPPVPRPTTNRKMPLWMMLKHT